ncbi:ABC transporter permease subunit, partial [Streptomyces brasiliscabiei]|uniref:ABC transporter permease subunit n=1 Tax=Streptomyces brasiliscabiei TaxID=2736302 RepID=UPI0038F79EA1
MGTTLGIISYSIIATFVMGFLFSLVHFSRSKVVSKIYFGFVSVMRATPVLLLLMLVFYGFPLLFSFFGLNIE